MSWKLKKKALSLLASEEGVVRKDWGGRVSVALDYSQFASAFGGERFPDGFLVVYFDGQTEFLPRTIDPSRLRAKLMIAGGG